MYDDNSTIWVVIEDAAAPMTPYFGIKIMLEKIFIISAITEALTLAGWLLEDVKTKP